MEPDRPTPRFPVDELRSAFFEHHLVRPIIVSTPTGSGKSTQIPRWCRSRGRVLVIEPRRVACRGLAAWVAELEGTRLGDGVGYSVRNDTRASAATTLLFVTTGVALRMFADGRFAGFDTVVLDELHERGLDLDLLLALVRREAPAKLVAMSATLDGDRVAAWAGGVHLSAKGRRFPVEVEYVAGRAELPDPRGLENRLLEAVERAGDHAGDILAFLPGKGEIAKVASLLERRDDLEVLPLHGGLTLDEQARVFRPARKRRIVLATNVAETSITVDGIGCVIDSGLVRRTRYYRGRGYLTLVPVAEDSRDQRTGRAGRTAAGTCFRLWDRRARLEESTPPEIRREALGPLLLAAEACGVRPEELEFLDAPGDDALRRARAELSALGAVDRRGLTARGETLFRLPVDAPLGRLLLEAEGTPLLDEVVDLVAALSIARPLFRGPRPEDPDDDLRAAGCDAVASIRAVRARDPARHGLDRAAWDDARRVSRELRAAWELPDRAAAGRPVSSEPLARLVLAADPRAAHVARRRGRGVAWSNGGTECRLGKESAVGEDKADAVAVLTIRAIGQGYRKSQLLISAAMPLRLAWLAEAALGDERLAEPRLAGGEVRARIERVYAGRVIGVREDVPEGAVAREAIARLFERGRVFPGRADTIRAGWDAWRLLDFLRGRGKLPEEVAMLLPGRASDAGAAAADGDTGWLVARLEELGVEGGDDLALLSPDDLAAEPVPPPVRAWIDRHYPAEIGSPAGHFRVSFDTRAGEAVLHQTSGEISRPPARRELPRLDGFSLIVVQKGRRRAPR